MAQEVLTAATWDEMLPECARRRVITRFQSPGQYQLEWNCMLGDLLDMISSTRCFSLHIELRAM